MNKKLILVMLTICTAFGLTAFPTIGKAGSTEQTVLVTTFPIYQIVRNVTEGRDGVLLDLMLPSQLGCPHDYALTPRDMQKLAKADILVVNGLGLEEFLGAPVRKANPKITVIDSSIGIEETLEYSEDHNHGHDNSKAEHHHHGKERHYHGHDHHHAGINPHLFASPRMTARLAMNVAAELSKADPKGAAIYLRNAQAYAGSMNRLADEMSALGKRLKNNRIVQPHGIFDYLARDIGLTIVAVMQAHGQEPSASEMMQLVKTIRKKQAGAIFTEPQYPEKVGKSLSKETGIPVAMLDPVATGPENAPLTYYETIMRQNMKTLESTLGVK
ncbi:MAG: High-affinity zinc uptake system binding-protein ZnuA precursor [Syntrophorhabdus sp. PtaU1.Bin153]|nr:MAG: High-affinity zinc uptake system binding-protein ZnuA precursor [Syntrophorhabdus sp. PtaU1.Bin153]